MNRVMPLVFAALACALVCAPVGADDPPKKLTAEERKELESKWFGFTLAVGAARLKGDLVEATRAAEEALKVTRQLFPKTEFPDGHANLAQSLHNVGVLYSMQAKYAQAEPLLKDSLEMRKRLVKGDHVLVAMTTTSLGQNYLEQGNGAEAHRHLTDALEMNKRLAKDDNIAVVGSLNNLGLACALLGKYADAERHLTDAVAMSRRLFKGDHTEFETSLNNLAHLYDLQGRFAESEPICKDVVAICERLYKGDHPNKANSLNNLAAAYDSQGRFTEAEVLYRDALEMRKRLFKGDHPDIAGSLNNLGAVSTSLGRFAAAEAFHKESLEMYQRVFKGDHPQVATSLNNLAHTLGAQGKYAEAKARFEESLEMSKRLVKGDHPSVATALNNLGQLCSTQGKTAEARPFYTAALETRKRLFKGDHPDLAMSLNNLAVQTELEGKYADAESLYHDALEMRKRLFKGDHPDLAGGLFNLARLYRAWGKHAEAEKPSREALAMYRRLVTRVAEERSEGEALTLLASQPLARDEFLSGAQARRADPAAVYAEVWAEKGKGERVYESRHQRARAASADPKTAAVLAELTGARRRRAELLLAPSGTDAATRTKRDEDIKTYEARIEARTRELKPLLPALERAEKLATAPPTDLQKALPPDAAVVDFLHFVRFEQDRDKPGRAGHVRTRCYVAFVSTREAVVWVDLDTAEKIEPVIDAWRAAITGGREIPATVPAAVRELVWEKVRKELPANTKTVYVCPDRALCKVPFAALPGDKPGTILLEDFAVATIPHAPFLLDKLWPQDPIKNSPAAALVVGAVKYDAELAPAAPATASAGPLVKPDARLGWSFLSNTVGEANGVVAAAERQKIAPTRIEGEKATSSAVLSALPKAKYAHVATHGFFADESFRGVFQLDEKDYETSWRGERIGRAANSPLLMTGLVLACANNPKAPGRGILTGEQLIDLDLSGLELAVLSACETGLGDVAGGEGTFGLQRAFHYAGTKNVVASLWKVPDAPTAALMALFYRNLWEKNLSPVEALRQAQLDIYRNPGQIPELAKGFRGKFEEVPGMGAEAEIRPSKGGKAHPLLWAAFTLSGPGR